MNRPEVTTVYGTSCEPPILTMLDEVERLMQFAKSAECVGRPAAVPGNPTSGIEKVS